MKRTTGVNRLIRAALLGTTLAFAPLTHGTMAEDAPGQIRWDLSDLYPSVEAWNATREQVLKDVAAYSRFQGNLGKSAAALADALDEVNRIEKELARMYIYSSLGSDEDLRDAKAQERFSQARTTYAEFGRATAFMAPELLTVGSKKIEGYIKREKRLEKHAFFLRDTLRQEKYTLGLEAEGVLANAAEVTGGAGNIYNLLTSANIAWPTVKLSTGEDATLSQAGYSKYRAVQNRDDRKLVFDTFWQTWKNYEATFGQTLDTLVKSHIFYAKSRHYPNALSYALSGPNIPEEVYRTLVKSVNESLPSFHRYLKLRQRMLGLSDMRYYDIYPETTALDREFSVDDAKKLTLESLTPFGEEYLGLLKQGFDADWMHVYPQPGKRSGAYMNGAAYDVHPYVLLNYNKGFEDVSTFSHEWGHAVHTLLSRANNPYETYSYRTFTAELASTTNEVLLQEHLLKDDLSDKERLYYIDRALEGIRGTLFRQTMFAEFELKIHEVVEAGEPLSGEKMTAIYLDLLKRYHGDAEGVMKIDDLYGIEWAYIPHFYRNFYVFQYATSISGGTMFAERMLNGDPKAQSDYLNVLKAGGSRYPYEMLKEAGVDLASEAPYKTIVARMNRLMDEADAILTRMGK
ncbi:oligoendopeptidase F [Pseudokordiimonas caeni]|uniref:oligoendopeptidase F n=1 Tax=Pseudokordiimonas caeni TaxID=2997908 RepID=UPI0028111755|nr:oligoendopeptidase F [Pseudokordiimonas caeni]